MKNLLLKLFTLTLFFTFSSEFINAQTMGKAGGNTLNFFDTNPKGGQIGHSQAGSWGNFVFNSRWIAIGQPSLPSGQELYGMRIQDREYVGTFNYTGNPGNKDLEIVYGTVPVLSPSDPPSFAALPDLLFKTAANSGTTTVQRMKLTSGGTLSINSNYGGTFYKLYVGGRAFSTGGWLTLSDARYKKGITSITDASSKLSQLNGVSYDFKKEVINGIDFTKEDNNTQLGFIAQDLEKVFPELVLEDEQGYRSVNYQGLIPVLVEGFNEQKKVIDEQSELITEQVGTIAALNNKVENMEKQLAEIINVVNDMNNEAELNLIPSGSNIENKLQQNRPNPFKGITTIDYKLPVNANNVSLIVYDVEGKQIKSFSLVDGEGSVNFDGSNLSAGTYIYALLANGKQLAQQKMVIQ